MDPREQLVVQLVLCGAERDNDGAELRSALEEICDDAIVRGVATSALVYQHQYLPDDKTRWEDITVGDDGPLTLAAWHATHIRGVDKRIWLSSELAARVDRAALARHVTVTDVGACR